MSVYHFLNSRATGWASRPAGSGRSSFVGENLIAGARSTHRELALNCSVHPFCGWWGIGVTNAHPSERTQEGLPMDRRVIVPVMFGLLGMSLAPLAALAQQTTGTPGSPSATMTIDGKQIPAPDLPFGGTIERNELQSKP